LRHVLLAMIRKAVFPTVIEAAKQLARAMFSAHRQFHNGNPRQALSVGAEKLGILWLRLKSCDFGLRIPGLYPERESAYVCANIEN
jgi:hypothetical protein